MTKEQKEIIAMAVVTSFVASFMGSALNLSIPNLEAEFQVGAALIGWVITVYTLAVSAFSVPLGKIADIVGRRKILITGLSFFTVTSVACIFSPSIWVLLAFRLLQGLASAMMFATGNAILISSFPANQRGRVLGISTAAVYVGLSAGPVVGGFLNQNFNWHSIFVISALISLVAIVLTVKGVPAGEEVSKGKIDAVGNILYIAAISVTLYGLTNLTVMKYSWVILVAGVLLGIGFVAAEKKADDPVIRVTMFSEDSSFTLSNIAALLNYGATFAISYLMSIYLQIIMGYSSQAAGLILIAQPAMQALFSPLMGKLSDRIAPYKLASAGMACCAVALAMFFTVSQTTGLWFIIMTLIVGGFGFAMFSSPNSNAIMSRVAQKDYGVGNSILSTMRTVGQSTSMSIVTMVVGVTLGDVALTEAPPAQLIHTIHILFMIFTILCIAGVFMSLRRRKIEKED